MAQETHTYLIYTVTVISLIITVATTSVAIYLIRHFLLSSKLPRCCMFGRTRKRTLSGNNSRRNSNCSSPNLSSPNSTNTPNTLKTPSISPQNSNVSKPSLSPSPQPKKPKPKPNAHEVRIATFFKVSASISLIFNALNTIFNSVYCIYLIADPVQNSDDDLFYIHHSSHIQRITSTFSWYIAKVALIWFFSGRLYYAFKGSCLQTDKRTIIFVNTVNTICAPVTLAIAYWSVYTQQNLIIAELSFNLWRILYQIIVFTLLYMFSKRLLLLNVLHRTISMQRSGSERGRVSLHKSVASAQNIENIRYARTISHQRSFSFEQQERSYAKFMRIVTRNAVLVLTISVIVLLVTFCFFGFRFVFGPQTRLTLLIPMNMAALDSCITSICIICLFQIGDSLYDKLCGNCCDSKCNTLCKYFAMHLFKTAGEDGQKADPDVEDLVHLEISPVPPVGKRTEPNEADKEVAVPE